MSITKSHALLLVAGFALLALSGCGQVEQALNEATEKGKQTAVAALKEFQQSGALDETIQSANQILQDTRNEVAVVLQEASEQLATSDPKLIDETSKEEESSAKF